MAVLGHRFKNFETNVNTIELAALEGLEKVNTNLSEQNKEHTGAETWNSSSRKLCLHYTENLRPNYLRCWKGSSCCEERLNL